MPQTTELPENVSLVLDRFRDDAKEAFGPNLVSLTLFGSAAEGRMRATSDVNVVVVLKTFDKEQADRLREPLRLARAAIRLDAMFLLESEIPAAAEAFAVKFSDISARHRVLHGSDPFARLSVSREATVRRLRQVIVNLTLRLRERYVLTSLREEQLALTVAELAGPLRACAATILSLEGKAASSPKEALAALVAQFPDAGLGALLAELSRAREDRVLKPGVAPGVALELLELMQRMLGRVDALG